MAYASSVSQPYVIAGGQAGGQSSTNAGTTACVGYNYGPALMGGGTIWGYRSSDPVGTVVGSSYFTNGYQLGMRLGDPVWIIDTAQSSTLAVSWAVVNAICTTPVSGNNGVSVFCGTLHST